LHIYSLIFTYGYLLHSKFCFYESVKKKFGDKENGENISEKIPENLAKKIAQSQEKLQGFFNSKNLRTLFSE
jgi:hypothetical protein